MFIFGFNFLVFTCFMVCKPFYEYGIDETHSLENNVKDFSSLTYQFLFVVKRNNLSVVKSRGKSLICLLVLVCGDVETCPGSSLFKNLGDFTILHQNICGLSGKIILLQDYIIQSNITETHLQVNIPTTLVNIRGYTFERNDRKSEGGGTGIYLKNDIELVEENRVFYF